MCSSNTGQTYGWHYFLILFDFILLLVFQRIPIGTKQLTIHIIILDIHMRPKFTFYVCAITVITYGHSIVYVTLLFSFMRMQKCMRETESKEHRFFAHTHFVNLMKCLSSAIHGIITTISTENRYRRRLWPIFNIQTRRIEYVIT